MNEQFYTIDVISRRVSMAPRTVRRYTSLGFIAPRAWQGRTPLYSETEAARLRKIARLTRDLGLNLAGVAIVLRLTDELEALRRELAPESEEEE